MSTFLSFKIMQSYFHFDHKLVKQCMYLLRDRAKHHQFLTLEIRGYFGRIPLSINCDQLGLFRWGLKH